MTLVFLVNFLFTSSKSRLKVEGSTSAKIGFAPQYSTTLAVDIQVKDGTMTSSPGFTPNAIKPK